MLSRVRDSWFLIALALALVVGISCSASLKPLADAVPRTALIGAVMFVTAMPIDLRGFRDAAGAGWAVALAIAINAVAAPPLGWLASHLLPTELATGLVVATTAPCTLASAAVWTRRGNGNAAVAVAVTVATSLGCFVVLPLWTRLLLGTSAGDERFFAALALKLVACVVVPLMAAQMLRLAPAAPRLASNAKTGLGLAAQLGVLTMALLGAIESGERLAQMETPISAMDWSLVALTAAATHTVLLVLGWRTAALAGIGRAEAVAVAIAGSQKTLAVGVGIALEFGGLAIFPMIAYHVLQLIIDTLFVDRLRSRSDKSDTAP